MTEKILFYKSVEPYGFLNNFTKTRIFVFGDWFDYTENAYQIQKTESAQEYDQFYKDAITPRQAQQLGQKLTIRSDWDQIKDDVMHDCVRAKFLQHHDLLIKLLATGTAEIVEDSPTDFYWGCGKDHSGRNQLGKILMRVREELKGFDPKNRER